MWVSFTDERSAVGRRLLIALGILLALGIGAAFVVDLLGPPRDDAIELVPPEAATYVSVFLEPSRDQRLALEHLIARLDVPPARGGVEGVVARVVGAVIGAGEMSFGDVRPWVGSQVAFFALPDGSATRRAALIAVADEDEAAAALDRAAGAGAVRRSYAGTDYALADGDIARALLDGFVIAGHEVAVRAALDAAAGRSLASRAPFQEATEDLPADRLGLAYLERGPRSLGGLGGSVAAALWARADALVAVASVESALAPRLALGALAAPQLDRHARSVATDALNDGYSPQALLEADDLGAAADGLVLESIGGLGAEPILDRLRFVVVGSKDEENRVLQQIVMEVR
ncbi:MAG: DUF3352 domain-containing protein [Actinomycetota bacterium]